MTSTSRLARIARWCATHRTLTIAVWVVAVVVVTFANSAIGTKTVSSTRLPGTESQRVYDLLAKHSPAKNGDVDQIVFAARQGTLSASAARSAVTGALERMRAQPGVADVSDPFADGGRLSVDDRIVVADVVYTGAIDDLKTPALERVQAAAFRARSPQVAVEHEGYGGERLRGDEGGSSTLIGFAAAAIVLLLTFGSFAAAGLPLITAVLSLVATLGGIGLLSQVMDTPEFASELASLIGIGVGTDYALFVLTRYRSELDEGHGRVEAIANAADTAGRTVLLAGGTVIVALLGLLLLGLPFLHGVAVGAALAVLVTMVGALTLLPALLATAGRFIEPRRRRKANSAGRAVRPQGTAWARWAAAVQRRPKVAAVAATALLLAFCAPVLGMRLGSSDASVDPPATSPYKAHQLISKGFGPGVNGTFLVAAELAKTGDRASASRAAAVVADAPGITSVGAPVLSRDGEIATFEAVPTTGPQDPRTSRTLENLREDVLPSLRRTTGVRAGVGGLTAITQDFTKVIGSKLPLFIGAVVLLSAFMLLVVFRSAVIPVKAAAMNVLSIGASLGLVTAIFQDGIGAEALGIGTGPIEPFVPVLTFAIVFGLSMDYEVFLLSRVREEWQRTGDPSVAVARGLARTGKVITAAAAIMVAVFGAFVLGDDRVIKMFGIALGSAIFIDAVIIRCLLVPALMELLGHRAWWLPAPFTRSLPVPAVDQPAVAS